jgi:hypothetical protein
MQMCTELPAVWMKNAESAIFCSDPEVAAVVFCQGFDVVVCQGIGVCRLVPEGLKGFFACAFIKVQP